VQELPRRYEADTRWIRARRGLPPATPQAIRAAQERLHAVRGPTHGRYRRGRCFADRPGPRVRRGAPPWPSSFPWQSAGRAQGGARPAAAVRRPPGAANCSAWTTRTCSARRPARRRCPIRG